MLKLQPSSQFKSDFKRVTKQRKDVTSIKKVINLLAEEKKLPSKYRDHKLPGSWHNYRECHIEPDLLLIYKIEKAGRLLKLMRLGSHAKLFNL